MSCVHVVHMYACRYHWENKGYSTFEDFLSDLKQSKRKSIRQVCVLTVDIGMPEHATSAVLLNALSAIAATCSIIRQLNTGPCKAGSFLAGSPAALLILLQLRSARHDAKGWHMDTNARS